MKAIIISVFVVPSVIVGGCTNGVVRLVDVSEVEKEIEKELNESKEGAK